MESNCSLILFIFGVSLLPKIYSDGFPSLFVRKDRNNHNLYKPADEFRKFRDGNLYKFDITDIDPLYNLCPQDYPSPSEKVLNKRSELKDMDRMEGKPLEEFVQGDFDGYNCDIPIKPIALRLKRDTPNDETTLQYRSGFLIYEPNTNNLWRGYEGVPKGRNFQFIYFLRITVNTLLRQTLWVQHQINQGKLLEPDSPIDFIPQNETNAGFYEFDIDSLYSETNQMLILMSVFGLSYKDFFDYPDKSLLKVQLAPYEDFLLDTWKLATFMDLNTTAIWAQLCPQWRAVEVFVRKVARELDGLDIETGTAEILSMGQLQPIYLYEGDKYPVAKYIYKLVKFEEPGHPLYAQAVIIIMHNNPYDQNQQPICDDISESLGWNAVFNQNIETGFTYVCLVHDDITSQLPNKSMVPIQMGLNLREVIMFGKNKNGLVIMARKNILSRIVL